ncbi:MAG: sulfatase-like hydrolase/transferase [Planctomycetes bacterium]|nr:sulfatase-like hydrolase/transferase [Planctomycetota bacterium]
MMNATTLKPFPRILSSILLFLLACSTARSAPGQPNVVVMLIDNHSFFELSGHGHPVVRTPRIDQFAAEGVSFSNFHAPPFCSPSRGALLTGRYALRAGIHNTVGGVSILHRDEKTLADQ